MKHLLAAGLLLALGACATGAPGPAPQASRIALAADGLAPAGSELRIDFGRAQAGVIDAVAALQGEAPRSVRQNRDCGAGPVTAATWDNGLTLNFLNGRFLGWVAQSPFQPTYPDGAVPLGTPADAVPVTPEATSLGQEFERGGLWHLIDETGQVSTIWAGVTCFFR